MQTSRRERLMGRQENCTQMLFTLSKASDKNNRISFSFGSGTPCPSLCMQSTSLRIMLALDFVRFSLSAIAHYSELHCFPLAVVLIITRFDCVLERRRRRRRKKKYTRFLCSLCKCVRRERGNENALSIRTSRSLFERVRVCVRSA